MASDGVLASTLQVGFDHGFAFGLGAFMLRRSNGIVEVMSSILIGSTKIKGLAAQLLSPFGFGAHAKSV